MSMYTQMLDEALGDLAPGDRRASEVSAVQVARRCRDEIAGEPAGADDDIVPMVLAREIGYDVALLQLARLLGIESDPSRFSQPRQERARLEQARRDLGVDLEGSADTGPAVTAT